MRGRDTSQQAVNDRLDAVLDDPCVPDLVEAFYAEDGPFAGASFDTLGNGAGDPDRFEIADLLAVTLMNVAVEPPTLRQILDPSPSRQGDLQPLLHQVPTNIDLWDDAAANCLPAAESVWDLLRTYRGIDWVTAGKLLARKRPRLIPVIDTVVVGAIGAPDDGYWEAFRKALRDPDRLARLRRLRPNELTQEVPDLRILDAAIWMRHSHGRSAIHARDAAGCQQLAQ